MQKETVNVSSRELARILAVSAANGDFSRDKHGDVLDRDEWARRMDAMLNDALVSRNRFADELNSARVALAAAQFDAKMSQDRARKLLALRVVIPFVAGFFAAVLVMLAFTS